MRSVMYADLTPARLLQGVEDVVSTKDSRLENAKATPSKQLFAPIELNTNTIMDKLVSFTVIILDDAIYYLSSRKYNLC